MEKIFDVMGCEDAFKTRLVVYKFEAAGTEEEQEKNFQWGLRRETGVSSPTDLPILVFSSPGVPLRATPTRFALRVDADTHESVVELLVPALSVVRLAICRKIARRTPLRVHLVRLIRSHVHQVAFSPSLRIMLLKPQVANAARNYEIFHERDDDDAERPDKWQKSGVPVMGVTRETGVSSPTDLSILISSSPGVPLRATPTRSALRVDADTQESVVELLADKKPGTHGPSVSKTL
nr:hypothetical protein [Tanacetum cinerariifolium]